VVADTSSLPEVAGDAARRIPPRDVAAWAAAIESLWADDGARCDLARRGPAQAARFSWERAARETLAIYRRVGR
jgi:glycosyltransferase involved in cell wall biosynthesis